MTRILTDEEWAELNRIREATLEQLAFFADLCEYKYDTDYLDQNFVRIEHNGYKVYDPLNNPEQNHKLLETVIKGKDCRLFHDDGVDEYFIYCGYAENNPPVAHNQSLNKTVFQAAMELYFPEEE